MSQVSQPHRLIGYMVIITKYGKCSIESITEDLYNASWRWKDVQRFANIVTNNLFWQVGFGNSIPLKSKIWWNCSVGSLP